MRTIALAALVVALATPAWAANDEKPEPASPFDLCWQAGTTTVVCAMKYGTEAYALETARRVLQDCRPRDATDTSCDEARAYIKQRWGY